MPGRQRAFRRELEKARRRNCVVVQRHFHEVFVAVGALHTFLPLQKSFLQLEDERSGEVHVLLSVARKRLADGLHGHLRRTNSYEKMYRLLGIVKYADRIKLPAGLQAQTHEQLRELQGLTGYICPGGCC